MKLVMRGLLIGASGVALFAVCAGLLTGDPVRVLLVTGLFGGVALACFGFANAFVDWAIPPRS